MKIRIKVYEEIKYPPAGIFRGFQSEYWDLFTQKVLVDRANVSGNIIEWIDKKGINTPYLISYV